MTFIRFWIGFTMIGIASAIMLLLWALRKRQFKESDRAGYLALADLDDGELAAEPVPEGLPRDSKVLIGILGAGVAVLAGAAVLAFAIDGE